ncbi:DNA gyrase inhibitor YacG [Thalassospira australica]|uniref:DNA gyrase inhibitor YacG n=1 Tax=Thalassospira australica TaxID=1528106 RepID=UPI00384BA33C
MSEKNTVKTAGSGCAMCGKPVVEKYKPFCSKRCADLDLGKWLNESYAVPVTEPPEYLEDLEDEEDFRA